MKIEFVGAVSLGKPNILGQRPVSFMGNDEASGLSIGTSLDSATSGIILYMMKGKLDGDNEIPFKITFEEVVPSETIR